MFKNLANFFKAKDIRSKILFTLGLLIVYRLGAHLTVPGVNAKALGNLGDSGIFGLLNTFSGGQLGNYSIFAMGVSPYITASIVVQLLQMDIIPKFVEWSKQGEVGRKKLNQVTRYLTIVLAFIQSFGISFGFNSLAAFGFIKNPGTTTYLSIALILTAGTMFLMWIGEQITAYGMGNGTSIIIFAGIVSRIPEGIMNFYNEQLKNAGKQLPMKIGFTVALVVAILLVVVLVIYMQQAARKIPIQYSKRAGSQLTGSQSTHLPLKVNSAGVIPVIFASSFIITPQTILQLFATGHANDQWFKVLNNIFNYQKPIGAVLYAVLIIVFTYFYAFIQVNPEKVAENLQKQGGYIPSVRPGKGTEKYISRLLVRLSTVGALFLGVIAILPILASQLWKLPQGIMLGGTSLLIIVGVALDTMRQLEGQVAKRNYRGFIN